MPFSKYFSQVHPQLNFPVRTTLAAFIFTCLYGLLYLASTTAFNSIVTSAVLFLNITYTVPQGILLYRGRQSLPKRYLDCGRVGYFCNVFSVVWIILLGVLICMPPNLPVTLESMNYTPVILVGVFVIINFFWLFTGRWHFEGPHIDMDLLNSQMWSWDEVIAYFESSIEKEGGDGYSVASGFHFLFQYWMNVVPIQISACVPP